MNVIIEGMFKNGFTKERKNKKTGEVIQDYICQIEQEVKQDNGEVEFIPFNVPVDITLADQFKQKKRGDTVKIPCSIFGENYANIIVTKRK